MISIERRQYFLWLSTAMAATSLALLVFIPALTNSNETFKWLSVGLFLISIICSVTTVLIHKEIEVFESSPNDHIKKIHHNVLLVSVVTYLSGFGAFCFSLKPYFLYIFVGCLLICGWAYRSAQNAIIRS